MRRRAVRTRLVRMTTRPRGKKQQEQKPARQLEEIRSLRLPTDLCDRITAATGGRDFSEYVRQTLEARLFSPDDQAVRYVREIMKRFGVHKDDL